MSIPHECLYQDPQDDPFHLATLDLPDEELNWLREWGSLANVLPTFTNAEFHLPQFVQDAVMEGQPAAAIVDVADIFMDDF